MAKTPMPQENTNFDRSIKLPVMIEVVFTLSKLTVILVGIIVLVATFAAGNPYWVAMLRGGITILGLGIIMHLCSWIVSKGVIDSAKKMLNEAEEMEQNNVGRSTDMNV